MNGMKCCNLNLNSYRTSFAFTSAFITMRGIENSIFNSHIIALFNNMNGKHLLSFFF